MSDIVTNIEFNKEPIKISALGNKINVKDVELIENGTYTPDSYGADGFGQVKVNVPKAIPALEELKVTQDGVYTPSLGVAGFSKVTAEFDTSSLPKVKLESFTILTKDIVNGTWDDYGYFDWNGISSFMFNQCKNLTHIDFAGKETNLTSINRSFYICSNLVSIRNLKVSNKCVNAGNAFHTCSSLTEIDTSEWDTSSISSVGNMFANCKSLQMIDTTSWDLSKLTDGGTSLFIYCSALFSIIGNNTIEDVLSNGIKCLSNIKTHLTLNSTILDRASLRAVINGLADLTGQTAQTLTLGATLITKLTEEDIAIATNKNWTIV
jgi:surface protein